MRSPFAGLHTAVLFNDYFSSAGFVDRKDEIKAALWLIKVRAIAWVHRIFPLKSVVILVYIHVCVCVSVYMCIHLCIYTYLQLQLVEGYRRHLGESLRWKTAWHCPNWFALDWVRERAGCNMEMVPFRSQFLTLQQGAAGASSQAEWQSKPCSPLPQVTSLQMCKGPGCAEPWLSARAISCGGGDVEAVSTVEAADSPNPVRLFAGVNDGGKSGLPLLPRGLPPPWSMSGTWEVRRGGVASSVVDGIFKSLKAFQHLCLGSREKEVTQVLWSMSSCEGYPWKSSSSWEQPRWPWVLALQVGGNWARIHPKSGTNGPTVVSILMWLLWGYTKGGWKAIESTQEEV